MTTKNYYIQYNEKTVKIEIEIDGGTTVSHLIAAVFPDTPPHELVKYTLNLKENGMETTYNSCDPLSVIGSNGNSENRPLIIKPTINVNDTAPGCSIVAPDSRDSKSKHPLNVKSPNDIESSHQQQQSKRTKRDEESIKTNNLGTRRPNRQLDNLIELLEKVVDVSKLNNAAFENNCLENRLDRRITDCNPNNKNNIKLLLAISGAGKTRALLELLYCNFGYYFTTKDNNSQRDFGSGDLALCQMYCDRYPEYAEHQIELLYFVRAAVCNYLIQKGFDKPWQILLAQLHPIAFFGLDLFKHLYSSLLREPFAAIYMIEDPFPFVAIDDIQVFAESEPLHIMSGCRHMRPFFSPFVRYSKMMGIFPRFLLSGTGMNFELLQEMVESSAMKRDLLTCHEVLSPFDVLSRENIEIYASQFLKDQSVPDAERNDIVSRISSFELCHGRPGFVAYILDVYMDSKDIDVAIGEFVSGISNVDSPIFPLQSLKTDLDNKICALDGSIAGDKLGKIIRDRIIEMILNGKLFFHVEGDDRAAAIRYGLGFGVVDGWLMRIEVKEQAIMECLRYFIPFAHIVRDFAERITECSNPQMVGYLLEYLVSFTLVANYSGEIAANNISVWKKLSTYLRDCNETQVCFPDHMCGPDIIYKCSQTKTVYIVQIRFLNRISKQEAVNACNTTDPERFYHKRNGNEVFKGFEEEQNSLRESLNELKCVGFSLQQMLFVPFGVNQTICTPGVRLVSKNSDPDFFKCIGSGIWDFLDSVGNKFS